MIAQRPHLYVLHGDDGDTDTWENEGGATRAILARRGWELFDPRDGRPVLCVRWRWLARFIATHTPNLDYARIGEAW